MKYSFIGVAVLALIFAVAAPAQPFGVGLGAGARLAAGPQTFDALKDVLGLSDAQVQQLVEMRQKAAEDNRAVAEQIRAKRLELAELLKATNPDPLKIGQLHIEIQKLQQQRLTRLEQLRTQTMTVLTAAQKQKLADLEKALALARAARQAVGLGLIAPPQPAPGTGMGPGMRSGRPGRAGGWI